MSNRFSNYLANALLNHLFGKGSYNPPTIYVALSTSDPGDDDSGIAEPSGNGYARVQTSASNWNASTARTITNAAAIVFPAATGNWGTISYFALFDAANGGNLLASGQISPAQAVINGNTMEIDSGGATITL